jgi:hypothetical protein
VNKPVPTKTPKQIYDLVQQREIALEVLPDGDVRENVQIDLARLRAHAETLLPVDKAATRKSRRD